MRQKTQRKVRSKISRKSKAQMDNQALLLQSNPSMRLDSALVTALAFLFAAPGQSQQLETASGKLLALLAEQHSEGVLLTYQQSYLDAKRHKVSYIGTVYDDIYSVDLKKCILRLSVVGEDRSVGSQHRKVKGTISDQDIIADRYLFEFQFRLQDINPSLLQSLSEKPSQLPYNTNPHCRENPQCNMSWLKITANNDQLSEVVTNGYPIFNGKVRSVMIPMTSLIAADKMIDALREVAALCERQN